MPHIETLRDRPLAWIVVPVVLAWRSGRQPFGLRLRACGENPEAVRPRSRVTAHRWAALAIEALLVGIAGADLALALSSGFAENMTAGRGFIALSIVIFGRWKLKGVLLGTALFGVAAACSTPCRPPAAACSSTSSSRSRTSSRSYSLRNRRPGRRAGSARKKRRGRMTEVDEETREQFRQIGEHFDIVGEQFDKIGKRFDKVDERFDRVNERFDEVDERFERIDERFARVDERFESVDARIESRRTIR